MHCFAQKKKVPDYFDIANSIFNVYNMRVRNIESSFIRAGLWDPKKAFDNIEALNTLFYSNETGAGDTIGTNELFKFYQIQSQLKV